MKEPITAPPSVRFVLEGGSTKLKHNYRHKIFGWYRYQTATSGIARSFDGEEFKFSDSYDAQKWLLEKSRDYI
jgi:hypothetical protein